MPKYFFDIDDGQNFTSDAEGIDLPGLSQAKAMAVQTLYEVGRLTPLLEPYRELTAIVRDTQADTICRVVLTLKMQDC